MTKRWVIKDVDEEQVDALYNDLKDLRVSRVLCKLLVQRGIYTEEEAKRFFWPKYDYLHDPFLMKDMDKAIDRIEQAIYNKEKIMIYGDYDVDGTAAVALVYSFLKDFYFYTDYFIPNRNKEGYGVSIQGIDVAIKRNVSLIIVLDCGIKAIEEVKYAKSKGVDVILCDHHRPGDELPPAAAILNPNRLDCEYPYKELSAAGIGFKLIQGFAAFNDMPFSKVLNQLDLVAISIAADIVPIKGENRVLAYYGLRKLNSRPRPGLKSLIQSSPLNRDLSISDIVYVIGPIINAAGRMDDAEKAVQLLISKERIYAKDNASALQEQNQRRRKVDTSVTDEAIQLVSNDPRLNVRKSTVVFNPNWHKGVIGIVASRLIERWYRPTVVLTSYDGLAAGSARSIPGFDIYNAISECGDLIEQFGGHKYAAGLTMKEENVPAFIKRFDKIVAGRINEAQLTPEIMIDAEVDLPVLNRGFYRTLEKFAPFGPGNEKPIFLSRNISDTGYSQQVGSDKHIRFHVKQGRSYAMKGIGFNLGSRFNEVENQVFDLCYSLEKNVWNDNVYLQLNVKDIIKMEDSIASAIEDDDLSSPRNSEEEE